MRLTESGLRRLVRSLLREALTDDSGPLPPPDEPNVAPDEAMGQYLMPAGRVDPSYWRHDLEADTDLELKLRQALAYHYRSNNNMHLRAIWAQLIDLKRRGLYSSVLAPPSGRVYRVMSLSARRAGLFLGVNPDDIAGVPHGSADRAPSPPPFQPRDVIASWTTDPTSLAGSMGAPGFINTRDADATVLLVADTKAGEFLMNPVEFTRGWMVGREFEEEREVLSGGTVPLVGAAWVWHGDPHGDKLDPLDVMRDLLAAVGK